jgi:hypothetical protein
MEKETIRRIRQAVQTGKLNAVFTLAELKSLGIIPRSTAGTFPWKHRVGNGTTTEYFIWLDPPGKGKYKLITH